MHSRAHDVRDSSAKRYGVALLYLFIAAYLTLADRLFLRVSSGGSGSLPLLPLVAWPVILLVVARQRNTWLLLWRWRFWILGGFYIALTCVLPIVGVLAGGYPARTLFAANEGLTAASMMLAGYFLADRTPASSLGRWLLIPVFVHGGAGAVQFLHTSGLMPSAIGTVLTDWDRAVQSSLSEHYILSSRSIGLFVNPNTFGYWSVLAFWATTLLLQGRTRRLGAGVAFLSLLLSQSRGAAAAFIASAFCWLAIEFARSLRRGVLTAGLRRSTLYWAVGIAGGFVLVAQFSGGFSSTIVERGVDRLVSATAVIESGTAADANLSARVDAWRKAATFIADTPSGTFGPPQLLFSASIDNEYFRVAMQGSLVFLFVLVVTFASGIRLVKRGTPQSTFAGFNAITTAIVALTALPLGSVPAALLWISIGFALGQPGNSEPSLRKHMPWRTAAHSPVRHASPIGPPRPWG